MKKFSILLILIIINGSVLSCSSSERINEDIWVNRLYANQIGSLSNPVQDLYVDNTTLYIGGVPLVITDNMVGPQGPPGPQGPQGVQGTQGTAGAPVSWNGTFASAPSDPVLNEAYRNSTDNKSYVYDGVSWQLMTEDGQAGQAGTTGSQGIQGEVGPAGPNEISTSTNSTIAGILKGESGKVAQALVGQDYVDDQMLYDATANATDWNTAFANAHAHSNKSALDVIDTTNITDWNLSVESSHGHSNKSVLDSIQEAFTTSLKGSYDWLVTNVTEGWKTSVDWVVSSLTPIWKASVDAFMTSTINGHLVSSNYSVTKTDVGLGNVPNTDTTNATNISSGTVSTARLGSGTANTTTFLRGDQSWQSPTAVETDPVVKALSGIIISNGSIISSITDNHTYWDTAYSTSHSHTNKSLLDVILSANVTSWNTAYTNTHTHSNITVLNATQESFTTTLKTAYDWLVTNITSAWKTIVDNFVASKGAASGLAPLDAGSKVPTANLGSNTANNTVYLRGDQTWQAVTASAVWGGITGTLSNQADLNTALAEKLPTANVTQTPTASKIPVSDSDTYLNQAWLGSGSATSSTYLRGDQTWATPAGGAGDVVFVATPANFAINSTTDVTIVTRDVTGVVANDQLIVEATFLIMNNSTATRVCVITTDFDAAFDVEHSTGALAFSTTLWHPFQVRAVLNVSASNLAYAKFVTEGQLAAGIASGGDTTMAATHLRAEGWGTTASDLTGTVTVVLKIRSANATATQTCYLLSLTIRKVTPT